MEATACRLRPLLRSFISLPSSPTPQKQRIFSSSSDYRSCRSRLLFFDFHREPGTGSLVYSHTLKTQRPSTIRWQKRLSNSVCFIGRVSSPLKTFTTEGGKLYAHTQLKVESAPGSKKYLTILLDMWEDMAEICIQHLKPNDYIYVSGYLRSFTKACDNGNIILNQKVIVKEINYVANSDQKTNNTEDTGESGPEKHRKRLHLWQVLFANPQEWQDLRKSKVNRSQPDFKHKGTGEALWLRPQDPPWVIRQLRLHDSRMADMGVGDHQAWHSNLSPFSYDDT